MRRRDLLAGAGVALLSLSSRANGMAASVPAAQSSRLSDWPGPFGGLPPVSQTTPQALEAAFADAAGRKRAEIRAIDDNPAPPTFANTVLALENSGSQLARVEAVINIFTATKSDDGVKAMESRITPQRQAIEDEILFDAKLFDRVGAVYRQLPASAPDADARRLVEVIYDRMLHAGAGLSPEVRKKLAAINTQIADLRTQFFRHLANEEAEQVVLVTDKTRLKGLSDDDLRTARQAAGDLKKPEIWAFHNRRPDVWAVATRAADRSLRQEVWRMWMQRGQNPGANNNAAIANEILRLRGEKAALLGSRSYADYALSTRMAKTPQIALDALMKTYDSVRPITVARIAQMQALAKADGADVKIEPWDYLYYENKLREQAFAIDATQVQSYLKLDNIVDAMMWSAGRLYGYSFVELADVDRVSPDIRVFRVARDGATVGVIYLDLYFRPGKQRGSWTVQYRAARHGVLPIAAVHSNVPVPAVGEVTTVPLEIANVIFHEFGHALHMISSASPYTSTGSLAVPWDFVEVPSLFNERWLYDEELLTKFALNARTGDPMPPAILKSLQAAAKFDRAFSVNLPYLGTAIVDLKIHMLADGGPIDVAGQEASILREIDMPAEVDLTMRALHSYHMFSDAYAAGVYSYLWSDMLAADVAEAFTQSPDGPYDKAVADRWYRLLLSRGNRVPIEEAFREFRGRDPDPGALMRKFGIDNDLKPR